MVIGHVTLKNYPIMKFLTVLLTITLIAFSFAGSCYSGSNTLSDTVIGIHSTATPSCEVPKTCTIYCSSFPGNSKCSKKYTIQIPTSLFQSAGCLNSDCNCMRTEQNLAFRTAGSVTSADYSTTFTTYSNKCAVACRLVRSTVTQPTTTVATQPISTSTISATLKQ